MRLRTLLLVLSISTVAVIVTVLFALNLDSLTKTWLITAVERNDTTGKRIQGSVVLTVTDSGVTGDNLSATKRQWSDIVAKDQTLADMLVQEAAVRSSVIVEINILGEDGRVLLSSIPSRQGQDAPHRKALESIVDSGFWGRLNAIVFSQTDYESRIPIGLLGLPNQTRPVFQIQLLVSPVLLRDKVLPDLINTAFVSILALFAAAGLAGVSAQIALRPVRRIGKALDTLATGKPLGLASAPKDDREDREVAAIEYKLSLLGEQIHGARRDADQMRTAFGSLARGVAHEIKNPLNAISLRLESLRMRITDEVPEAESEIDLVSNEVQRLDRVVRTFLDLNRPMELEIAEFDPVELAATILENMRPAAKKSNVELQLVPPATPFRVQADRGLVEQGLLNLVTNAIQAAGVREGAPIPAWVRASVSLANGNCEIAVTDNGTGMPENVQERIFEPYFTTKASGSGIGLAMTKRTMELHHGNVRVKSSPGEGTTMVLSFPAMRSNGSRT